MIEGKDSECSVDTVQVNVVMVAASTVLEQEPDRNIDCSKSPIKTLEKEVEYVKS